MFLHPCENKDLVFLSEIHFKTYYFFVRALLKTFKMIKLNPNFNFSRIF